MTLRQLFRLAIPAVLLCTTLPAWSAASKDAQALKKLDDALKVDYPASKYDKAERTLRSAIDACGFKLCSKEVIAKVHIAIGVVRGKASGDVSGARKEFEQAKKADPKAELDPNMVSPPVGKKVVVEFYKAMEREVPARVARGLGVIGNVHCVPDPDYEIQTAQPIAVVCDPIEGAVRAELNYRMGDDAKYTALLMTVQDGTFRANIPCEPLTKPGTLDLYVVAQDMNNEKLDTFGTSMGPVHYKIVKETKSPAPSYPGQDPPKRCTDLLIGGANLGESCTSTQPCKKGLYCDDGACHTAPACETDSDCDSKRCDDGYCSMGESAAEAPEAKPSRWMFGLHGGLDLWVAGKWSGVCGEENLRDGNFACYNRDSTRVYNTATTSGNSMRLPMTDANARGALDPGFRMATVRVMASADYVFTSHLSAGVRLGWAFLGGPRSVDYNAAGNPSRGSKFIPVHAEARGTYWLRSLGKPGLHPYAGISAGMAEVDVNSPIKAKLNGVTRNLDAWRKLGPVFGGVHLGVHYSITPRYGVLLNVNSMFMLPTTGIVLEPSLGGVLAF